LLRVVLLFGTQSGPPLSDEDEDVDELDECEVVFVVVVVVDAGKMIMSQLLVDVGVIMRLVE
jgi:hypothetical protein